VIGLITDPKGLCVHHETAGWQHHENKRIIDSQNPCICVFHKIMVSSVN